MQPEDTSEKWEPADSFSFSNITVSKLTHDARDDVFAKTSDPTI